MKRLGAVATRQSDELSIATQGHQEARRLERGLQGGRQALRE